MIEDRFTNNDGRAWRLRNRCTVLCFAPTTMLEGHLLAFEIAHDLPPPFVKFSRGRERRKSQHFDQSHENKEKDKKFMLECMISGRRKLWVIRPQSPICGPHAATGVWVLRDCELAETEVRIKRSLAGMGINPDGKGRGGKSQGCSALGSGASISVHLDTSQALVSCFGLLQVSFPSIISS